MTNQVRRASDVNSSSKAGQAMSIPDGLLTRLCAMTGMMLSSEGSQRASVQFACGAWLAGYRTARGLAEAELSKRVGISVRQLRWLEWGLAERGMLSEAQCERLVANLAEEDDAPSLRAVVQLALGEGDPRSAGALRWVLDDLAAEIWSDLALETVTNQPAAVGRLSLEGALMLEELELGPRDSHGLFDAVARRLPAGRAAYGKSVAAAVLYQLVEEGAVIEMGDAFQQENDRDLAIFRLTPRGRYALQLHRAEAARRDNDNLFLSILRFLDALVRKTPPWGRRARAS